MALCRSQDATEGPFADLFTGMQQDADSVPNGASHIWSAACFPKLYKTESSEMAAKNEALQIWQICCQQSAKVPHPGAGGVGGGEAEWPSALHI